ncbi:MAG: phosphopantothenoylcysteine decarboxylase [Isosphaeraceae bacterium]
MARILLGITGSVAAVRSPRLIRRLREFDHSVRVIATEPSLYFFDPDEIVADEPCVFRDRDEWPGSTYRRGDSILHIDLRDWADVLCMAPLDANTLAKLSIGLADNLLTCLFRAWDFSKPILLAPAMNTRMWESPVTIRHLRQILDDHGDGRLPSHPFTLDETPTLFAEHAPRIRLIPPQEKLLACGDFGNGALAEVEIIVAEVNRLARLPRSSATV